jgi:hypothetical protein
MANRGEAGDADIVAPNDEDVRLFLLGHFNLLPLVLQLQV